MDNFMTATCTHKNNPTGANSLTTVQSGIKCTPLDPLSASPTQAYPIEKLFLLREFYTKYAAFQPGDYATFAGVDYPIQAVHPWMGQGGLDTYYRVLVEVQYGS